MNNSIPVLILAGGQGTRIKHLLGDLPKPMYPVSSKPFLDYQISLLQQFGFQKIYISSGYKSEVIEQYYSAKNNIKIIKEEAPLGTGGAVLHAAKQIEEEEFICLNGDSLCLINFSEFVNYANNFSEQLILALNKVHDTARFGRVEINNENEITAFNEKDLTNKNAGLINSGIYFLRKNILDSYNFPEICSMEKDIFPALLTDKKLMGCPVHAPFIDIGTPETLAQVADFVEKHYLCA